MFFREDFREGFLYLGDLLSRRRISELLIEPWMSLPVWLYESIESFTEKSRLGRLYPGLPGSSTLDGF